MSSANPNEALIQLKTELHELQTEQPETTHPDISWRANTNARNNFYTMDFAGTPNYHLYTQVQLQPGGINGLIVTHVILEAAHGDITIETETVPTTFSNGNPADITRTQYIEEVNTSLHRLAETAETRELKFRKRSTVEDS